MKTATKLLIPMVLGSLWLAGCQTPAGTARKTAQAAQEDRLPVSGATATVGPQFAQFYFPVEDIARQWQWQAGADNLLEYQWAVSVQLKDEVYQLGFSRFCFGHKEKSVGTFEELLASGQVSLWKRGDDRIYSLEPGPSGVTARRQGDGLMIELSHPKLLAKLLAQKPATLRFQAFYPPHSPHREEVRVTYP